MKNTDKTKQAFLKISALTTYHEHGYDEAVSMYPDLKEFIDQNKDKEFKQVEADIMRELEPSS